MTRPPPCGRWALSSFLSPFFGCTTSIITNSTFPGWKGWSKVRTCGGCGQAGLTGFLQVIQVDKLQLVSVVDEVKSEDLILLHRHQLLCTERERYLHTPPSAHPPSLPLTLSPSLPPTFPVAVQLELGVQVDGRLVQGTQLEVGYHQGAGQLVLEGPHRGDGWHVLCQPEGVQLNPELLEGVSARNT